MPRRENQETLEFEQGSEQPTPMALESGYCSASGGVKPLRVTRCKGQNSGSSTVKQMTASLACLKTARLGYAPLHASAVSDASAIARYHFEEYVGAWRRRAIKRQLRRGGIEVPDAVTYNLQALRSMRAKMQNVRMSDGK